MDLTSPMNEQHTWKLLLTKEVLTLPHSNTEIEMKEGSIFYIVDIPKRLTVTSCFSLQSFSLIDCCSDKQKQIYGDIGKGERVALMRALGCLLNNSFHRFKISFFSPPSFDFISSCSCNQGLFEALRTSHAFLPPRW